MSWQFTVTYPTGKTITVTVDGSRETARMLSRYLRSQDSEVLTSDITNVGSLVSA